MLSILPFYVPVSGLLEVEALKARGQREFSQPCVHRNVDAVWRRIADNEANLAWVTADSSKSPPDVGEVGEVPGNHEMIILLPPVGQPFLAETFTDCRQIVPYWRQETVRQQVLQAFLVSRHVL